MNSDGSSRTDTGSGEISLVEIYRAIYRRRRVFLVLPVILAILVGTWSLTRDRRYAAVSIFVPQLPEARTSSLAASLARQFDITTFSARPAESPVFYADLLVARPLLQGAIQSQYAVLESEGTTRRGDLLTLFREPDTSDQPLPMDVAMRRLRGSVDVTVKRETGVVELRVTARHPELAEQIAGRLLELLNQFNLQTLKSQAQEEARFVGERLEESAELLSVAESELESFLKNNRQWGDSPTLAFEHDRLARQVAMRQEIQTSLLQAHEQARIESVRDTPVITVIQAAVGSAEPQARGTITRTVLGFLLGLVAAAAWVFLPTLFERFREPPTIGSPPVERVASPV